MKKRNFLKSHHAKRYRENPRHGNPLFSHKKRPLVTRKYIILPIFFLVITGMIWLILSIPLLRISTIEVSGLVTIYPDTVRQSVQEEIDKPVYKMLSGSHIWLASLDEIKIKLKNEFQFKSVDATVKGRTLYIDAEERITRAIWISNGEFYFLDSEGIIVRKLTDEEKAEAENQINTQETPTQTMQLPVLTIWNLNNGSVEPEESVTSSIVLTTIDQFDQMLRATTIQPISYTITNHEEVWLNAKTTLGVDIYVNGVGDAQVQFDNLQLIIEEYQDSVHDLEYIDLRFGNRVYVK